MVAATFSDVRKRGCRKSPRRCFASAMLTSANKHCQAQLTKCVCSAMKNDAWKRFSDAKGVILRTNNQIAVAYRDRSADIHSISQCEPESGCAVSFLQRSSSENGNGVGSVELKLSGYVRQRRRSDSVRRRFPSGDRWDKNDLWWPESLACDRRRRRVERVSCLICRG